MGDAAVLEAPTADFIAELDRMRLVTSRFKAVQTAPSASFDSEVDDLRRALARDKIKGPARDHIVLSLQIVRDKLQALIATNAAWESTATWVSDAQGGHMGDPVGDRPEFPPIIIPPELPGEFSDYLHGAAIWHNSAILDKTHAREAWERILQRPAVERKYKSVWAAYMLGKLWTDKDNDKAVSYFQQVRALAAEGFADSIGLAASSLGWEARIYLLQHNCGRAIQLYLEQLATDDATAYESLRTAASSALNQSPAALASYARHPQIQRVITAYLISLGSNDHDSGAAENTDTPQTRWLDAVERADIKDVDSAEKLALAAYRNNRMDAATRWIKRAPRSQLARWIHAKILLHDGKVDRGIALLAQVVRAMPIATTEVTAIGATLARNLSFYRSYRGDISIERHALGELGVLQLSRHEYVEALDALLHAGFWVDASYVAERVLTLDELKSYVEAHWPTAEDLEPREKLETDRNSDEPSSSEQQGKAIRYLLARRLTRDLRGDEARPFYPENLLASYDALVQNLRLGWDESVPKDKRASALFQASQTTRNQGMELLGTELQPDATICAGNFRGDNFLTWEERASNIVATIVPARGEELRRSKNHSPDPEVRFHYRFQAAALAWEAAKLMPNNSDETAYVLWAGGCYIKSQDAETADIFYKSLVRRNRKTALGAEADRIRWFPRLDEAGNIVQDVPANPKPVEDLGESNLELTPANEAPMEESPVIEPQP